MSKYNIQSIYYTFKTYNESNLDTSELSKLDLTGSIHYVDKEYYNQCLNILENNHLTELYNNKTLFFTFDTNYDEHNILLDDIIMGTVDKNKLNNLKNTHNELIFLDIFNDFMKLYYDKKVSIITDKIDGLMLYILNDKYYRLSINDLSQYIPNNYKYNTLVFEVNNDIITLNKSLTNKIIIKYDNLNDINLWKQILQLFFCENNRYNIMEKIKKRYIIGSIVIGSIITYTTYKFFKSN